MLQATVFFILFYQIHSPMASVSLYKNDFSAPKAAFLLGTGQQKWERSFPGRSAALPFLFSLCLKVEIFQSYYNILEKQTIRSPSGAEGLSPLQFSALPGGGNPVFAGQCFPRCCELWLMRRHLCRDGHHHTGRGCGSSLSIVDARIASSM